VSPDTVIREWFREVWDEGNEAAIDRLMAPDAMAHGLSPDGIVGPAGFKPFFRSMRAALGDLRVEVQQTVTEGDRVAAHCHVIGRHVGDTLGGPPTDRPVDFWGMTIARVSGGQIVEAWNSFDFLTLYQQVGWVSDPPLPVK
jgi:predicted ester cyclase